MAQLTMTTLTGHTGTWKEACPSNSSVRMALTIGDQDDQAMTSSLANSDIVLSMSINLLIIHFVPQNPTPDDAYDAFLYKWFVTKRPCQSPLFLGYFILPHQELSPLT